MLTKNKKVYLEEKVLTIIVSQNINYKKIVADLIELNFFKYFLKNNLTIEMEDVLFISDSVDTAYTDINAEMFDQFSSMAKRINVVDQYFHIPTIQAHKFLDNKYIERYFKEHGKPSLVILGFINNIPEEAYENIYNNLGRSKLMIFGDEIVSGVELSDYYSLLLTNAGYTMSFSYSEYRKTNHKKINSLITKLRDKNTQSLESVPSNSSNVFKRQSDEIDIDFIMDKLDSGYNIVVPRRMFCSINSKLFNTFSSSSTLKIEYGDTFFSRFPFIAFDEKSEPVYIPAMSKVNVTYSRDLETHKNDRLILLRDLTVTKPNGVKVDLKSVPIDFTGYICNFDPNDHISNYDDFDNIEYDDPNYYDPYTLSVLPFRIFTEVEQKYINSVDLVLYKETFNTDTYITNTNNWFQEIFNVTNSLEIIHDEQFNDL